MATPVKNFTDPTALSRLSPVFFATIRTPKLWSPFTQVAMLPNDFHRFTLMMTGVASSLFFTNIRNPRIPLPPMGRQMVLTFPPVYKSRDGIIAGFTTPRQFPQIMISPIYRSQG